MKFPCDLYEANMALGSMHGPKAVKPKSQTELDDYVEFWNREIGARSRKFLELHALYSDGTRHVIAKGVA
jgi:hypothetical protein